METGRRRRNKLGFVDEQVDGRPPGEGERILLSFRKVDRWRFFTHLARRASICIKLIGSPYWLLLHGSKRDGIPWQREEGVRSKERREDVAGTLRAFPPSPFYPFPQQCKERIADAVREAVKIFFENKDTVSG